MDYMDDEDPIIGEVRRIRGAIFDLVGDDPDLQAALRRRDPTLVAKIRKAARVNMEPETEDTDDLIVSR